MDNSKDDLRSVRRGCHLVIWLLLVAAVLIGEVGGNTAGALAASCFAGFVWLLSLPLLLTGGRE